MIVVEKSSSRIPAAARLVELRDLAGDRADVDVDAAIYSLMKIARMKLVTAKQRA